MSNAVQMNSGNVSNTARDYDDIRLHDFLYQSGPIVHSTLNIDCKKKFEEIRGVKKALYKQNEIENNTVPRN